MTECERIIEAGVISAEFLKEETRCDYFIDCQKKKLWAIELDLINKFDKVCKKNGLKYFMAYGTLLGAIRHKGFIPWDDDIDVFMFRDDYEKLIKLSHEFESPYFLQTPYTDPNYFYSYAKIRNDNTTFVSDTFSFQGFHSGVFLDVFVLDDWVPEDGLAIYNFIKFLNLENSTYMRKTNPNLTPADIERVKRWKGVAPIKVFELIQEVCMMFHDTKTDFCADAAQTMYEYGRGIFPKSAFRDARYVQFENLCLPAPIDYDVVLKNTYSDYMEFPPVEKRGTWHPNTIINPDESYKKVLKDKIAVL